MTRVTGRYEDANGLPIVRFERTFPHPVAAVWSAVTDPAELEAWFPTTVEFEQLTTGEPITFRFPDDAYPAISGRITAVDEPHAFEFTWGDDVLAFELAPDDGGRACRLSFTVQLDAAGKAARDSAGWESHLDLLSARLAGAPVTRPSASGRWREYYDEYRRLGLPATAEIPEAATTSSD